MRRLGWLALACYAAHACVRVACGHPEETLWACHVASALIGMGLLLGGGKPERMNTIAAIGGVWITVGTPLWLVDLAHGGEFILTSPFTHVGGLAVAIAAFRRTGVPRGTWWKAFLALTALQLICRWCTPEAANVNGAFRPFDAVAGIIHRRSTYLIASAITATLLFWTSERVLRATTPARRA